MTDVTNRVQPDYAAAVAEIRAAYAAIPPGSPVRLAKRTSNLFRFRDPAAGPAGRGLDVSAFRQVLQVDPAARTAVVGGMTTYEDLVDATLRHGLMPLVVPQLKTITLGGAVTGLGIESTSLRNGLPHESVLAMDILTGDGRVVTATPGQRARRPVPRLPELLRHARLRAVAHHRAGAGRAVRAPAALPVPRPGGGMDAIAQIAVEGSYQGHRADFVDGTMFSLDEMYLTLGAFSDVAPWQSDYTGAGSTTGRCAGPARTS